MITLNINDEFTLSYVVESGYALHEASILRKLKRDFKMKETQESKSLIYFSVVCKSMKDCFELNSYIQQSWHHIKEIYENYDMGLITTEEKDDMMAQYLA